MTGRKQSLREFQAELAARLRSAAHRQTASKLGFTAGGRHWLVDLTEVNEVVSEAVIVPVPWAKSWFLGLASIRGAIYGCSDLAGFLGLDPGIEHTGGGWLLAHPRFGVNAALRIERTLGLRQPEQMASQAGSPEAPPWLAGEWRDDQGLTWTELSLERLLTAPSFLDVGRGRQPMARVAP